MATEYIHYTKDRKTTAKDIEQSLLAQLLEKNSGEVYSMEDAKSYFRVTIRVEPAKEADAAAEFGRTLVKD